MQNQKKAYVCTVKQLKRNDMNLQFTESEIICIQEAIKNDKKSFLKVSAPEEDKDLIIGEMDAILIKIKAYREYSQGVFNAIQSLTTKNDE